MNVVGGNQSTVLLEQIKGDYMGNKRNIEDYIGQEFGRLTVLGEGEPKLQSNGYYRRTVRCQCNCENHTICDIYVSDLFRREDGKRKQHAHVGVFGGNHYKSFLNYLKPSQINGLIN